MLADLRETALQSEAAEPLPIDTGHIDPKVLLTEKDRSCLRAFDELSTAALAYGSAIFQAEQDWQLARTSPREAFLKVRLAHERYLSRVKDLYREILSHTSNSLESSYDLRKQLHHLAASVTHLDHTLRLVQGSKAYKFSESLRTAYHRTKQMADRLKLAMQSEAKGESISSPHASRAEASSEQNNAPGTPDAANSSAAAKADGISGITQEHQFYSIDNPYAKVDNSGTSFEVFRNWVTVFHYQDRMYGSQQPLVNDWIPNITELDKIVPIAGKRVLELGSLEGGNTKQLLDLGAREVIGIEASAASFMKSLVAKNEFALNSAQFVYGDCNVVLDTQKFRARGRFDLCYCSGILYHLEDPLKTIDLISGYTDTIYVWSQVATERMPAGDWVSVSDAEGRIYSGRLNHYYETTHIGGIGRHAVWLSQESLYQAFRDRGFAIRELGGRQTFKGDSAEFLATRL